MWNAPNNIIFKDVELGLITWIKMHSWFWIRFWVSFCILVANSIFISSISIF